MQRVRYNNFKTFFINIFNEFNTSFDENDKNFKKLNFNKSKRDHKNKSISKQLRKQKKKNRKNKTIAFFKVFFEFDVEIISFFFRDEIVNIIRFKNSFFYLKSRRLNSTLNLTFQIITFNFFIHVFIIIRYYFHYKIVININNLRKNF